jgi:hypothetical protein
MVKNKEINIQKFKTPIIHKGYTTSLAGVLLVAATFTTGVIYIVLEWVRQKDVSDSIFISMLIAATIILVFGITRLSKYILNKGLNYCIFLLSKSSSDKGYELYDKLCTSVLNLRLMTISGILYGIAIGSVPFVLNLWSGDIVLKISLSTFMFCVNFVTGVAFYSLITFFIHSIKMGKLVNVNLWQINNPTTDFFLGATRRISVLASIYICICLSSILFSPIPIGGLVIAYSCFSGCIIISSLVLPPLPVMQKLKEAKTIALLELDKQLYLSFYKNLEEKKPSKTNVDFDKVKTLLDLREKIEDINIWPFRVKSAMAGLSVMLFSSVPIILQIILTRVFG